MKPSDGIQMTVRAVLENAYVRAAGAMSGKSFHEVNPHERSALVERFEEFILADIDILTAAMEQHRLEAGLPSPADEPSTGIQPFSLDTRDYEDPQP